MSRDFKVLPVSVINRHYLEPMAEAISKANFDRVERALRVFDAKEPHKAAVADCLAMLWPGVSDAKAQSSFRTFRKQVNDAFREHEIPVEFVVEQTNKRAGASERFCWFAGPDPTVQAVEEFSVQATGMTREEVQGMVHGRAITGSNESLVEGRGQLHVFVSCAEKDRKLAAGLLKDVDFELQGCGGVERLQVFRLERDSFANAKSYQACSGVQRDEFARESFRVIEVRVAGEVL